MDAFDAGRRKVITRLAARLAEAIRNGEDDVIDLCHEVLQSERRRQR